jgi:photosystem II stability/assembly factor-like uncharacterized protein
MRTTAWFLILFSLLIVQIIEGSAGWERVGPNFGGPNGFVFHSTQNLIYTTGGSILRSTDDGRSWVDTGNGVGNFKIDPFHPDSLLAITSSVLVSDDQGMLWKEISRYPFGSGQNGATDFEFHSTRENFLYAVSNDEKFFKSINRGGTWEHITLPQEDFIHAVEVDPNNGDHIFVMGMKFLFQSSDGGLTFTATPHVLSSEYYTPDLILDKLNPNTLYALLYIYGLSKSTDEGKSWQQIDCGCSPENLVIDPHDSNKLYLLAFESKPLVSSDGGKTWKRFNTLPFGINTIAANPRKPGDLIVSTWKGIYRSFNFGNTWSFQKGVFPFSPERMVAVPQKPGKISGLYAGGIYSSSNYGKSWRLVLPNSLLIDLKIHPKNTNVIVASGWNGNTSSTDGGSTWSSLAGPASDEILLDPVNEKVIYAVTTHSDEFDEERIVKTSNSGKTWKFIDNGIAQEGITAIALDPQKPSTLFAATREHNIYSSNNDGKSWLRIGVFDFEFLIDSLAIHPKNSSIIFIDGGTFRSIDRGKTWTNTLWGFPRRLIVDESTSTLYSTGDGLYVSNDSGKKWTLFDQRGLIRGITDTIGTNVYDLIFSPWKPGDLYLSHDRGFYSYHRNVIGPEITQVVPMPARAGQQIVINGNGFGQIRGEVLFSGGAKGNVTSWSDTKISVILADASLIGTNFDI